MANNDLRLALLTLSDQSSDSAGGDRGKALETKIVVGVAEADTGMAAFWARHFHGWKSQFVEPIQVPKRDCDREKFSTVFRVHRFGVNGSLNRDKGVLWVVWSR